jgi:biopolymer transport protein ExbB/TolQ
LNGLAADDLPSDSKIQGYLLMAPATDSQSRAIQASALRLKLTDRIVAVRHIANSLIFLGLIGTVIGFIIALSGVDPTVASEVENVAAVVSTLIDGMSVALNTTLIGAVFYLWLTMNYRILTSGTVSLISEIIEVGERRASAG